ncbi:MAG: glycosyltransferase family 4 protein [Leadbetterella sp.]
MRFLVLHNILWSHYKSVLFEALQEAKPKDMNYKVIQIARNEVTRAKLEEQEMSFHYNYELLFDDFIENVSKFKKVFAVFSSIYTFKPDVILITGYGIDLSITLSIPFSKLFGIKVILSSESTANDQGRTPFKEWIKKRLVGMSDYFVAFGSTSRDYLFQLGAKPNQIVSDKAAIIDDRAIVDIFNKSDANSPLFSEIKTAHNFIFVGRLIPEKNLSLLLSTFQKLKENSPDFTDWGLILLGDGSEEENVNKAIHQSPKDIYRFGSVDWKGVSPFFKRSDCLLLTSVSETWGLVVNEAMVCSLPVIVSNKCGCKDDLVKDNGFIFKSANGDQLANCMQRIAENPELRIQMGKRSLEIIEEFKVEKLSQAILEKVISLSKP